MMQSWAHRLGIYGIFVAASSACTTLQSVSVTDLSDKKGKAVHSEASQWQFLGLSFSSDYLNSIVPDIRQQCSQGEVSDLITRHYTIHYPFINKVVVESQGICHQAGTKARR